MLLRRFYEEKLAQASYLVGCRRTGEALVVDPTRDVRRYLEAADARELRITHVTETHIHADFVSGSRELARRAGARLYLSDAGPAPWKYGYADEALTTLLRDGDAFRVGQVRIDVLHTPGHTPEHLTLLVTDTATTDRPMGALTGDFLFVGDVGRPDLLERAARLTGTMEGSARSLFRSLERFRALPDWLQLWPGHGAGSACGKALGAMPQTTLGYEKLTNWAFQVADEDEFVRRALAGQPEPPRYFAVMKRLNQAGPPVLGEFPRPPRLALGALEAALARRAVVVDTRPAAAYAAGHLPGTINLPLNASFTTWAGWLVPYGTDFYLLLEEDWAARPDEVIRDLTMIGLERVAGHFGPEVLEGWAGRHGALEHTPQITAAELAARRAAGEVAVVDVRGRAEWEAARIAGVANIPVGYLAERAGELSRDRPVVVHCQSGARSMIGASVLQALGYRDVLNLSGGLLAWERAGYPVERGVPEPVGPAAAKR